LKDCIKKAITYFSTNKKDSWEILIACRLYIVFFFLILPVIYFIIQLNYISPVGIGILGISFWLILKYVIFESRKSAIRYLKNIIVFTSIIFCNFALSLNNYILNVKYSQFFLTLSIISCSILYFIFIILIHPFESINSWASLLKENWTGKKRWIFNQNISLKETFTLWLIISLLLITLPYPVYIQKYYVSINRAEINQNPNRKFGIWTYGPSLDEDNIGAPEYLHNETLEILADAGIYFIYGVNKDKIGKDLVKRLNRCKYFGIEVYLTINPLKDSYTNIWTFESAKDEIIEILDYLKEHDLLGNPITTLDYDMEVIPDKPFPFYGFDLKNIDTLSKYYEIQEDFERFNKYIRNKYELNIRITTDIYQMFDKKDGDDDLTTFYGLLSYKNADMACMVYRRNDMGQNFILDHCKILHTNTVIILNAWKDNYNQCWKNLDCAIKDARIVLSYPGKSFRIELWELAHFLYSYGENGLIAFLDAIKQDVSKWPEVIIWNTFPYSFFWDAKFISIIWIDIYGPLFKLIFRIFK
jgi:hypothetical protein